jgi:hypothetical protein
MADAGFDLLGSGLAIIAWQINVICLISTYNLLINAKTPEFIKSHAEKGILLPKD